MKKAIFYIATAACLLAACRNNKQTKTDEAGNAKADSAAHYKVLKKIKIGGEGGWDYAAFDTVHRHLFLSHGTQVEVLDVDNEKLLSPIPNTAGVHGICFDYELNKGFTSNGKDSSVTVFDLNTLKVLQNIKLKSANPDAITYDPYTRWVFTFNGKSHNTTAIDAATGNILGEVDLGGKPEFCISNGSGKLFVNIEDKNEVKVIDSKNLKVTDTWPLDSGKEPTGMAFDMTYKRLFIATDKYLEIKNTDNGRKTQTKPIGDGADAAAFNDENHTVFTSNGDGTLSVIHQTDLDHYTSAENIPTQKGARTMAIDVKKDRIYLPVAEFAPEDKNAPVTGHHHATVPGTFSVIVVGKK